MQNFDGRPPQQIRWRFGRKFAELQRWRLDRIAEAIGLNLNVAPDDLQAGALRDRGGIVAARALFGDKLLVLLDEMNEVLA